MKTDTLSKAVTQVTKTNNGMNMSIYLRSQQEHKNGNGQKDTLLKDQPYPITAHT